MSVRTDFASVEWQVGEPRQQANTPCPIGEILPLVLASYGIYERHRPASTALPSSASVRQHEGRAVLVLAAARHRVA